MRGQKAGVGQIQKTNQKQSGDHITEQTKSKRGKAKNEVKTQAKVQKHRSAKTGNSTKGKVKERNNGQKLTANNTRKNRSVCS